MRIYSKYIRNTNLDVALGACVNCLFFSELTGVEPTPVHLILLFNSVWIIYTADRLMDSKRRPDQVLNRHRFHFKNRRVLILISTVLVLVNIFFLQKIEQPLLIGGAALSSLVLFYFLLLWKRIRIPKEVFIAMFYSAGVSLVPLSFGRLDLGFWVLIVLHVSLAFANLLIISAYEKEEDKRRGEPNLVTALGSAAGTVISGLFISQVLLALLAWYLSGNWVFPAVLLLMGILLQVVYRKRTYFGSSGRYGAWVDAAFFIPGLIYLS